MNRRGFLKLSASAIVGMFIDARFGAIKRVFASPLQTTPLATSSIQKYTASLVIPPAMPRTEKIQVRGGKNIDYYEIAIRQFQQQILPTGMPSTIVWGYGSVNHPGTFNFPSFTIEAKWKTPVRVKWINDLKDANGGYLPHLLPVDPTLHWANPPGGISGRDMRPMFDSTPGPYTGPVPMVTHVHGSVGVGDESDGYAEAWFLPAAKNIPNGYATVGTWYNTFKNKFYNERKVGHPSDTWADGTATFQYPNDQRASTLWYHDHSLGMTRLNVYAGPAGFFIVRGGPDDNVIDTRSGARAILPGPAPQPGDKPGKSYYEIPIVVQDRSFNDDGSLFYPDSRALFDDIDTYIPDTDVPPIWHPEFFGNIMVVNGRTWPFMNVEQRRYRFRFLNGCDSRFIVLKFDQPGVTFWQIGTEGGFLPTAVQLDQLLMSPAERADVIVDFSKVPAGTEITLLNLGPDVPFNGLPIDTAEIADPSTTGQVMQFRVVPAISRDITTPPQFLKLPRIIPLTGGTTRPLALMEKTSEFPDYSDSPVEAKLGTFDPATGTATERAWMDEITENPVVGTTEVWEFYNLTMDAHPMHVHEVLFQVVNRQLLDQNNMPTGLPRPPESWETGFKDTVISLPGEVTRIRAKFNTPGLFVWHCHIVEHEDNEMMRPYAIGPVPKPTIP